MKISPCSDRPILVPCDLRNFYFQVDPYVGCQHRCHYCYVLNQAETDWRREIQIHRDIVDQLSRELDEIRPQTIYMGYYTDPYQPCEKALRQTRNVLELFLKKGFSASILTKSDLVLRDIELLREMNSANIGVSVAFNDNRTRQLFEADTIDTERRIDALRKLKADGIATSALVCPVIPHITDAVALIDALVPHTDRIWLYGLSVPDPDQRSWHNVQDILRRHFPGLKKEIETAVLDSGHCYWSSLRNYLQELQNKRTLNLRIHI
jgi:DNA repair photolyase